MTGIDQPKDAAPSPETERQFSIEVEIDGLPFTFKGLIDQSKKKVSLSLHIPPPNEPLLHGEIGYVVGHHPSTHDADVYISTIKSYANQLPSDSLYRGAHVGRFLMNNLLAVADMNGWTVKAVASTSGRLSDDDVYAWMERRGFPPADTSGPLVRQPQSPDTTQPITRILQ